ncbi:DMT superfamily transport protein [Natronomonas pharaonis DSM 2160]|uniref:DMT superfamily transport protein n=1 Tax=Natronomonas pharaonis (strain ATCC 35678 / DSM 2160 / CIP 103997 / JCM 8858 / NBRC 14720 / NCIMB 2260 / Gabara) TaxID=348780 RepID=A0A1U7EWX8_NATPD|nr:EamA family transporter [Natronomonas pharaonis]CAI49628.1 DMT superfamily transport protein [Natronomonas pharaonis DSM 2160]
MRPLRNLGLFFLLAALWGFSFPAISAGLEALPPLLFAALRYDVGGVVLLAFLAARGADWRPRTGEDALAILIAGAFLIAGNSLLFVGQQTVPSGVAAIIYALIPVLTTALAAVLLPAEPLSARRIVGVALGLVGVAVIARPDPEGLLSAQLVGVAFVVAAALSVALGSVLLRRRTPTVGVAPMTAWAMVVGGLLLHAGSFVAGERLAHATPSAVAVVSVVYLAVFASAVGYVVYFTLLERFGPLEINLVSYVVPVVATLGGIALLGETLTAGMVAGFVLIASGFVVIKARTIADELGR